MDLKKQGDGIRVEKQYEEVGTGGICGVVEDTERRL